MTISWFLHCSLVSLVSLSTAQFLILPLWDLNVAAFSSVHNDLMTSVWFQPLLSFFDVNAGNLKTVTVIFNGFYPGVHFPSVHTYNLWSTKRSKFTQFCEQAWHLISWSSKSNFLLGSKFSSPNIIRVNPWIRKPFAIRYICLNFEPIHLASFNWITFEFEDLPKNEKKCTN